MKYLPGVPYAHATPALGAEKRVTRLIATPVGGVWFAERRLRRSVVTIDAAAGGRLNDASVSSSAGCCCSSRSCSGVSILIFFWVHALPGDPAAALLGERATPELVKQYEERYGLDRPAARAVPGLPEGHGPRPRPRRRASRLAGRSRRRSAGGSRRRSSSRSWRWSSPWVVGLPLGFFAAKRYGGVFDHLSLIGSLIGISIPIFFLAIILKYLFAVRWHWLPSVGREDMLVEPRAPDGLLRPRRADHARLDCALGRDQASDLAGDRARLDSARR